VTQKGEELLDAQYLPKIPGPHIISVTFNNQEIPQSPIKVIVEPDVDVGKIKVTGIDQSKNFFNLNFILSFLLLNTVLLLMIRVCVYDYIFFLIFFYSLLSTLFFSLNIKQLHKSANHQHLI
jgi:hypothetical protein